MHVYHNFILHIKIFSENILYHLIVIQHLLTLEMTPETGFFK